MKWPKAKTLTPQCFIWPQRQANVSFSFFCSEIPSLASLPFGPLGPNQFCCGSLLYCCRPYRTSVHAHIQHSTLNQWRGPPPSGQRRRRCPVHLIHHGSPLRSAPLDPVQHLFSHQGTLCWRGVAVPLYRLALPSWGSGEDEVWDSRWQNVSCN